MPKSPNPDKWMCGCERAGNSTTGTYPQCKRCKTKRNAAHRRRAALARRLNLPISQRAMRQRKPAGTVAPDTPKRINDLTAKGFTVRAIAAELGISHTTVQRLKKHPELARFTRKPVALPRFELVSVCSLPEESGRSYSMFPPKRKFA